LKINPDMQVWAQTGSGTLRVATTGTDTPACGSVAAPCRTIQYAVELASPSDEILVATGTYTDSAGTVVALDKTVILQGGWNSNFTVNDPDAYPTTLDAGRMGRVISITGQVDSPISPTIDGFIITQGDASTQGDKGGGLYSSYANPIVVNNVFTDNIANSVHYYTGDGGGLYLSRSPGVAIIRDNVFIQNTAAITGGWGQGGAIFSEYSSPQIIGNLITDNSANGFTAIPGVRSVGGNGGGIVVYYGMTATTVISGNQILNNVGSMGEHGTGGGMTLGKGPMLIQNNTVRGNVTSPNGYGVGGGIILSANAGPVTITGNLVEDNIAGMGVTADSSSRGGGIFLEYMLEPGPVVIEDNTIVSNTASAADIGLGGGVYVRSSAGQTTIRNNQILSNTGSAGYWAIGGGVYVGSSSAVTVIDNLIEGNRASTAPYTSANVGAGGGVATEYNIAGVIVQGNTVRNNVAALLSWGEAGGYYSREDNDLVFEGNLIEGNVGSFDHTTFGGGAYLESGNIIMRSNTLQENTAAAVDGYGGGVFVYLSGATLDANTIVSNTAASAPSVTGAGHGGGVVIYGSVDTSFTNNLVAHNKSEGTGAGEGDGLWIRGQNASYPTNGTLLHNTIADNGGEGIWIGKYATVALTNNIVAGHAVAITNTAPTSVTLNADYSLFWNNGDVPISGTNALFDDPAFVGSGDYHLSLGSPAIDAGVDVGVGRDIDYDLRPIHGIPDIGADEYLPFGCTALTDVAISGSSTGITDTLYAFTAVILPANVSQPITYTWSPEPETGQGTAVASYQWTAPGVYSITLAAENCGGIIRTNHTIVISTEAYRVYLPVIMNQSTGQVTGQVTTEAEQTPGNGEITPLEQRPIAPVLPPSEVWLP
jgi:hypothetical protein